MISHLTINGASYVGLFGRLDSGATIRNLGLEAVEVHGNGEYVAGLAGCSSGRITGSYAMGMVAGSEYVGGLAGYNAGNVTASYSISAISGDSNVGGLVGENRSGSIMASYSEGTVRGASNVGGLVGHNRTDGARQSAVALVGNCYSTCAVSRNWAADVWTFGGLVGNNNNSSIATSYSAPGTPAQPGGGYVFGLVGQNSGGVTSSFWDREATGIELSDGGTGLTTADMQVATTFKGAGWDLAGDNLDGTCDYWQISPGDYPRLRYGIGVGPVMPEGSGTTERPYLIRDANDLGTVWFEPLAHYRLATYLDLSEIIWSTAVVPWFEGTFDGNDCVISNLCVQGGEYVGLFGQLGPGASVLDVILDGLEVNGNTAVGGLAGLNGGKIANSSSNGTISGGGSVGGLVGLNAGNIANSSSNAAVSGGGSVGGLAGKNPGSIVLCCATGTVSGSGNGVGGLVGDNESGSITQSCSTGTVTGSHFVGGLVGYNNIGIITTSWSTAQVAGDDCVGGLVGYNSLAGKAVLAGSTCEVGNCYSTGAVSGDSKVGGLVGCNVGPGARFTVHHSYSTGQVTGRDSVGGLVGSEALRATTGCYFLDTVGHDNHIGTPLTDADMRQQNSFVGWDFVGETANGTDDVWKIVEGLDYPRLWWEPQN